MGLLGGTYHPLVDLFRLRFLPLFALEARLLIDELSLLLSLLVILLDTVPFLHAHQLVFLILSQLVRKRKQAEAGHLVVVLKAILLGQFANAGA